MLVDLDKADLIYLLLGVLPDESLYGDSIISTMGKTDTILGWVWNIEVLEKTKDTRLYFIYKKCKKSLELEKKLNESLLKEK